MPLILPPLCFSYQYNLCYHFREFLDTFLELLRRRFGTKRVQANIVYQEHISDKEHTHMNSTQWETLTDFVKWMGREGEHGVSCVVVLYSLFLPYCLYAYEQLLCKVISFHSNKCYLNLASI